MMTSILFKKRRQESYRTEGVVVSCDPRHWQNHRFGLSKERWERLCGRPVWITGSGTGYGRSLAVALAAAGCQVFLTGRRRHKLEETLREAESFDIETKKCCIVEADLGDSEQIRIACQQVQESCLSLYGLIHSAAVPCKTLSAPLQEESLEVWDQMMRVNVTAPWLLTRQIFPHMIKGIEGRVLFLSSGAGWGFTPGYGPYNVSKAALNSLAASTAGEFASSYPDCDIQINALDPGEARTDMNPRASASPYAVVSMALLLLSHPPSGPNGKFFHRDGRHLAFGAASPYPHSLTEGAIP